MKRVLAAILLLSSGQLMAASYKCELKARENYQDPYAIANAVFDGSTAMQLEAKGFTMKLRDVIIEGNHMNAMWLGVDHEHSAVTLAPPNQETIYLNLLLEDRFAIGNCAKIR